MNWARVAFTVCYAAAVGAAAYRFHSAVIALGGVVLFAAAVLLWGAVASRGSSLMNKLRSAKEFERNINKVARDILPALQSDDWGWKEDISQTLRTLSAGLMEGYKANGVAIFPTSFDYSAYLAMMPRFVFAPNGREVGDLMCEASRVHAEVVSTVSKLKRMVITLRFPVAAAFEVERYYGRIHDYYSGLTCPYSGMRLSVYRVALLPSLTVKFTDGNHQTFYRLLEVELSTVAEKSKDVEAVLKMFKVARRTDNEYYRSLSKLWQDETGVPQVAEPEAPRDKWFIASDEEGGHLRDGFIYFGDRHLENGAPYWVPISKLTHFLVSGMSGSGKSVFLHQILAGVAYNEKHFDDVYLIDLKGGVELWRYNGTVNGLFHVFYEFQQVVDMVEGLNALMDKRLASMRERGIRDWDGNKVLVVVDEFAELSYEMPEDKDAKAEKQRMLAGLSRLSSKARAAGIILWAQLQKGTTDVMDSGFRNNLQSEVMFCQKTKLQAATVFGPVDSLSVDPTRLRAGEFVMLDATTRELVYLKARRVEGME